MLHGRDGEQKLLGSALSTRRPTLVLVHGPQGVGKTALLKQVLRSRRHVHFRAAALTDADNRALLGAEIASLAHAAPPAGSSWEQLFQALQQLAEHSMPGLTLVLDRWSRLCDAQPDLARRLRCLWDQVRSRSSPLHLVLCDSDSAGLRELRGRRGALAGLDATEVEVGPLGLRAAAAFFAGWTPDDQVRAYALLGGIPARLERCDPARPLADNLRALLLEPGAPLRDDPVRRLERELRSVHRYASVLRAVAGGATQFGEILACVPGFGTGADLGPYLRRLVQRGWIERHVELGEDSRRARHARYTVADPFVGFWFSAVLPAGSRAQADGARHAWREVVAPRLEAHVERVFARICRAYVVAHGREILPSAVREAGELWNAAHPIPIAARLHDRAVVLGDCAWSAGPRAGASDPISPALRRLRDQLPTLDYARRAPLRHLLWFDRAASGAEAPAPRGERLVHVGLEQMLGR